MFHPFYGNQGEFLVWIDFIWVKHMRLNVVFRKEVDAHNEGVRRQASPKFNVQLLHKNERGRQSGSNLKRDKERSYPSDMTISELLKDLFGNDFKEKWSYTGSDGGELLSIDSGKYHA